jgi:phage baseplate assembly protein W
VKNYKYVFNDKQLNGVVRLDVGNNATVAINNIDARVEFVNVSSNSKLSIDKGSKLGVNKEVRNNGTIDITGTLSVGEAAQTT